VSPAFAEDPLRVLRVARFAARFGFSVAPETEALLREIAAGGELATLTAERVWQELAKALMEARPSLFFEVLRRCGADRIVIRIQRLNQRFARRLAAAGPPDHLGEQLKGPFRRAKIGQPEADVGRDDADERDRRKIMALGDHLRSDQDVDLAGGD